MNLAELTVRQLLLAGATFALVISIWLLLMLVQGLRRAARERAIARRLGQIDENTGDIRVLRLWREGEEATTIVPNDRSLRGWWRRMQRLPEDAGWTVPFRSLALGLLGAVTLAAAIAIAVSQNLLLALGAGMAVLVLFWIYARYCIARNLARFERQFADALQLLARSLKAGHPLSGAFRLTAEELQPPVSTIFAEICQEQSLGVNIEESLRSAAEESPSPDMKLFATSVAIQLRSGGNLADMMDRLADVIRSRIRLGQRVRVVTAQTQLSKRILLVLPLLLLLLLSIVNPAHLEPLFSSTMGHYMLLAGGVAMVLGWYVMNQMSKLRY